MRRVYILFPAAELVQMRNWLIANGEYANKLAYVADFDTWNMVRKDSDNVYRVYGGIEINLKRLLTFIGLTSYESMPAGFRNKVRNSNGLVIKTPAELHSWYFANWTQQEKDNYNNINPNTGLP